MQTSAERDLEMATPATTPEQIRQGITIAGPFIPVNQERASRNGFAARPAGHSRRIGGAPAGSANLGGVEKVKCRASGDDAPPPVTADVGACDAAGRRDAITDPYNARCQTCGGRLTCRCAGTTRKALAGKGWRTDGMLV